VHTRFLQVEGEKMSKSAGNFYTIRDLIDPGDHAEHVPDAIRRRGGVDPLVLRYALLQGQYRKPFNFKLETLRTASKHLARFGEAADAVDDALSRDAPGDDALGETLDDAYRRTLDAMCDDLNTPAALAAALEGLKAIRREGSLNGASARSAQEWLDRTNDLLGIVRHEHDAADRTGTSAAAGASGDGAPAPGDAMDEAIDALLDERAAARSDGDYARADAIRDTLQALGIEIMDTPDGTEWRREAL
jgi:cysteinyl-tRNA synthetase